MLKEFNEVPSDYIPGSGELHAILHTNHGEIDIKLFEARAPKTVANFVGLATGKRTWVDPDTFSERNDPFYDGVIFHRVIKVSRVPSSPLHPPPFTGGGGGCGRGNTRDAPCHLGCWGATPPFANSVLKSLCPS